MNRSRAKKISHAKGFSLVELLVSLSIFSTVMTISIGTILVMIDINAKAQAIFTSSTNVAFALDNITREIRTGHHYYCGSGTGYTAEGPQEVNSTNACVPTTQDPQFIYFTRERDGVRSGYKLSVLNEVGYIEQYFNGNWTPITSIEDVDIETFSLRVQGITSHGVNGDVVQPGVDLIIEGKMSNGLEVDTEFSLETHVAQRRLDII